MRFLLLNQFFYPDTAATSQYLTDLVWALSERQNVTVICGAADYTDSSGAPGEAPPNVSILRIANRGFSRHPLFRSLSYFTFFVGATKAGFGISRSPGLILTLTTPPFIALIGTLLKRRQGSRHIIWEMDVYPDVTSVAGFPTPVNWLLQRTAHLARYIYRHADAILVLGECMRDRLIANGVDPAKLHITPNWADGIEITPLPFPPPAPLVIHYSGNFGLAHDIDTIRTAISTLAGNANYRFVFAGGGRLRERLSDFCRAQNIANVDFQPYCDRAALGAQLATGHIGLVTMTPKALGAVVPSKVYGIMAAGRPVLFIGPAAAEPARIINRFNCGWHVEVGDTNGLLKLLQSLSADPTEIEIRSARARAAFETHYDRPIGIARIVKVINDTMAPVHTNSEVVYPAK